jgi:DNA (cytosine-5)-methyltransferase 1
VAPARPEATRGAGDRTLVRRRPVAVDLFAGAGGFALGLEQAGFDVAAAVEYDPIHATVHEFNFPLTEVVCADASTLKGRELRMAVERGVARLGAEGGWDGKVDVVFGGPPCQGFSSGGKRRPEDDRNLLVFDFARLVDELRPRYFALENVPPLKNYVEAGRDKLLDRFVLEMEACGYRVLPPQVVNASRWGVPQDRRRLIVLGHRKREVVPEYPTPTTRPVPKRAADGPRMPWEVGGREEDESLPVGPTVADAIGDLPDLDDFEELWTADEVELTEERLAAMDAAASWYARRLRGLDFDEGDLSRPRAWDRRRLTASARTRHELRSIARFAETEPGESEPRSRFYRLDPDGLCSTIRAGTGYERGSFMAPRPIHPRRPRVISPREAARLHSFPDWFRFHVTKWHAFREIGNSLPPLLARAIGVELVKASGLAPEMPTDPIALGDESRLALATADAARHFSVSIDAVPSHRLRHRKKQRPVVPNADQQAA